MARLKKVGLSSGDGLVKTDNRIDTETMKMVKQEVARKNGMKKYASGISVSPGSYYNPLYTPTSLMLPRDRKQINVWCRHFYMTEAIPGAVIDLYASLPITGFEIECKNPHVRKFMQDMTKRLKLREILQGLALEYFMIGDVFIMSELDEDHKTWKKLTILNPDQVEVRKNVLADMPVIEMIPDDDLKSIVFNQRPPELYQYFRNFLPDVIRAIKDGKNVPIDPAHITHFKHMPTPYSVYGTPLLKRIFKTLMYKEMLRRAQFVIAERYVTPLKIFKLGTLEEPPPPEEIDAMQMQLDAVLNDPSLVLVTSARLQADWQGISGKTLQLNGEYDFTEREMIAGLGVSRAFLDGCLDSESEVFTNRGWLKYNEINQETDLIARVSDVDYSIEFVKPISYLFNQNYEGVMYHFKTGKIDMLVSPEHNVYVQQSTLVNNKRIYDNWHFEKAKDLYAKVKDKKNRLRYPFRTLAKINHNGDNQETVTIGSYVIKMEDFVEFAGYYVSEGCYCKGVRILAGGVKKNYPYIQICQKHTSRHLPFIDALMNRFPKEFRMAYYKNSRAWYLNNAELAEFCRTNFYTNPEDCYAETKMVPQFIKNLNKNYLEIFLQAANRGDGHARAATKKKSTNKKYLSYGSISKQLADDIQEIAFKIGYNTKFSIIEPRDGIVEGRLIKAENKNTNYIVNISCGLTKSGNQNGEYPIIESSKQLIEVEYKGYIWCMNVGGSHLFLARRNNQIFISGNSGPTYANASIGGNAFLQKLENFRETIKQYVEEKIFKPICILNDFYDRDPDTDEEYLIEPEFKWDALRLQDEASRQQAMFQLRQANLLSAKTLLDAYHINPDIESANLMDERDTIYDANRIAARQIAMTQGLQMQMQMDMQKQMMALQSSMGMMDPSGGAGGAMGGGQPGATPPQNGSAAPPSQGGGATNPNGDLLSGFGGGGMQSMPGNVFAPMDGATSRPPIAASQILNEMLIKIQGILEEKEDN